MLTVILQDTCHHLRGIDTYQGRPSNGFSAQKSTSWHEIGIYGTTQRTELGYNATGLYGLDTLGLMSSSSEGPTLGKQVIAGVVNPRIWLVRLGVDIKPINFSEFANPQRSMMVTLKEERYISSLKDGYTAGAYYSESA